MNNKKQPTNQSENTLTEIFKYEVKEGVTDQCADTSAAQRIV